MSKPTKPIFTHDLTRALDCVAEGYPVYVSATPEVTEEMIRNALAWYETEEGQEHQQEQYDI